jgi:uncharacterized membrane protein
VQPVPAASAPAARHPRLDAWRGAAIVWMAAFHFCFDLNLYGFLIPRQVFNVDPFWTLQRSLIVSMFLLGAGAGQAAALAAGQTWPRFWRRWAQVAGCAVAVSIGSRLMFPASWISFGVLHGMAAMLLLLRVLGVAIGPARRSGAALAGLLALAAAAWVLPHVFTHPFFDSRWTNFTGLVTKLPVTEDYVPVLPWLGMMLAGFAGAGWLLAHRPALLAGPLPAALGPLAALGRWSLSFYMVHQPVLIGLVLLARMYRTMPG